MSPGNKHPALGRRIVDYAGMAVPVLTDGKEHQARLFVASTGVSGRLYAEATLNQKIDDWCGSHVRCLGAMGWAPQVVVCNNGLVSNGRYINLQMAGL